jgi:hypothetical protein
VLPVPHLVCRRVSLYFRAIVWMVWKPVGSISECMTRVGIAVLWMEVGVVVLESKGL